MRCWGWLATLKEALHFLPVASSRGCCVHASTQFGKTQRSLSAFTSAVHGGFGPSCLSLPSSVGAEIQKP